MADNKLPKRTPIPSDTPPVFGNVLIFSLLVFLFPRTTVETVFASCVAPNFTSGCVSCGFVSSGCVSSGFVSSDFVSSGFVSSGFVSSGFVSWFISIWC